MTGGAGRAAVERAITVAAPVTAAHITHLCATRRARDVMASTRALNRRMATDARAEKTSASNLTRIRVACTRVLTDGCDTVTAATTHQTATRRIRTPTHRASVRGRRLHDQGLATVWTVHTAIVSSRKLCRSFLEPSIQFAIKDAQRMHIANERSTTNPVVIYTTIGGQISMHFWAKNVSYGDMRRKMNRQEHGSCSGGSPCFPHSFPSIPPYARDARNQNA
jgi:hypothetical protein